MTEGYVRKSRSKRLTTDDIGTDKADARVQWGKELGPYCRFRSNGSSEGDQPHTPSTASTPINHSPFSGDTIGGFPSPSFAFSGDVSILGNNADPPGAPTSRSPYGFVFRDYSAGSSRHPKAKRQINVRVYDIHLSPQYQLHNYNI